MNTGCSLNVSYWPPDTSEPLLDLTLGQLLRQVVQEVPDRLALIDGGSPPGQRRRWTYRELLETCERVARALLELFDPGDRVAVCAPNCPEWIMLQHGLHMAGMILVPVNPAYRESEIETILKDSGAVGLFYVDRYRTNSIADIVESLRLKKTSSARAIRLAEWEEFLAGASDDVLLPVVKSTDILHVQYTSGTTGTPKGACLHHLGAINTSRFVALRCGFAEGGVWLNAMPLFHIGGSVVTGIGTLALKGTYVLMPGFDAGQMLELIESEQANATLIVPTMIHSLLEHPDFSKYSLDSLRTILTGAAIVPAALVRLTQRAFGCNLSILFGQTELNGVVSQTSIYDSVEDQSETLGRPLPNSEVAIFDPDTGEIQPIGVSGEICVRGYQTMVGYYGHEEATRECISEDGWLHMGDIGTMDSRGYLRIAGRLKDMIIRGGINLYPREIEDVLFDHWAVAQVSVIGLPDEKWGEVVAAVITLASDAPEAPWLDLHNYCRDRLAAHKSPALWFVVKDFPLTPSGKIQKFVLRDKIIGGEIKPVEWERPTSLNRNGDTADTMQ